MEIPEFWFKANGAKPEMVRALFGGPDDVRAILLRITENETQLAEMPVWMIDEVRGLRPLSRRFLALVFEQGGCPLLDTPWTRSLGFYGDWVPHGPELKLSGKWMP